MTSRYASFFLLYGNLKIQLNLCFYESIYLISINFILKLHSLDPFTDLLRFPYRTDVRHPRLQGLILFTEGAAIWGFTVGIATLKDSKLEERETTFECHHHIFKQETHVMRFRYFLKNLL